MINKVRRKCLCQIYKKIVLAKTITATRAIKLLAATLLLPPPVTTATVLEVFELVLVEVADAEGVVPFEPVIEVPFNPPTSLVELAYCTSGNRLSRIEAATSVDAAHVASFGEGAS